MKVGITGSNGFIGSHTLTYLNKQNIEAIPIDLRKLEYNEAHSNFDWILHFAANTIIPKSLQEADKIYLNNLISTGQAISIANKNRASFLFLSSYVYGKPHYLPIDENHPVDPNNSYVNSKLIGEKLCKYLLNPSCPSLIILRCFNIYGFDLNAGRLIHDIIFSAKNENKIVINDPIPKRDYLYIEDFCDLIIKIIKCRKNIHNIFNVGFGRSYSNFEVAENVRDLMKDNYEINVKNDPRENDIEEIIADISSIKKIFNWFPKVGMREGLKKVINQWAV